MIKNVVFMGTPDFAVGTLEALINSKYEVSAVFTQPDKPKGRGKAVQMTPVKEVAMEHEIPVYQPVKIREEQWIEVLKDLAPDVIVVVAFGQIIPKAILELPKYGCINVHESLLPAYRGAAPIQWAVINGDEKSGVTTMRMDTGLDTGDMILKEEVTLDKKETGGSLFDKLSEVGARLLIRTLEELYAALGERRITLCRELTKKFETVFPTTLEKALDYYKTEEPRGEYVLVVEGKSPEEKRQEEIASWESMSIEEHMAYYEEQGMDNKSAMKQVAKDRGVGKREIYQYLHGNS